MNLYALLEPNTKLDGRLEAKIIDSNIFSVSISKLRELITCFKDDTRKSKKRPKGFFEALTFLITTGTSLLVP